MIARGFFIENSQQFLQLVRILAGEIMRLAELFVQVVEFPWARIDVLVRSVRVEVRFPCGVEAVPGPPAVFVDGAVATGGEVLQCMARGASGLSKV